MASPYLIVLAGGRGGLTIQRLSNTLHMLYRVEKAGLKPEFCILVFQPTSAFHTFIQESSISKYDTGNVRLKLLGIQDSSGTILICKLAVF